MFVKGHNRNQGKCPYGHTKDRIDSRGNKACSRCQQAHHQARRGNISFEQALARPENCEICGAHESEVHWGTMTVDHCHESEKFRGWLCFNCNRGLQIFEDNPGLLRAAADYLEAKL